MQPHIYLDYMATTPVDPRVVAKMNTCLDATGIFGNPSSTTHHFGWKAAEQIEWAALQVANLIQADSREIIWTSGATEAINLALKGAGQFYKRQGKHIVTMQSEHKAAMDVCQELERAGFEVTYLQPEKDGLLNLEKFISALRSDTILASVMWVNNEIGVIQPISEIAKITREKGIILHVDAAQAAGKIKMDWKKIPIDLLSLSAHKVYGPKGAGALVVRRDPRVRLIPQMHGGGQQWNLRSGTLPTHQVVGMGEAFRIAALEHESEIQKIIKLRDLFWKNISVVPNVFLNGHAEQRVPHNLNIRFEGVDGEALLLGLEDVAVARGSACTSATLEPSHILLSIGLSRMAADQSLRFSFGRYTTEKEIIDATAAVQAVVTRLRSMSY